MVPELALVDLRRRSQSKAAVETREGTWVLSRPSERLGEDTNYVIGDPDGEFGTDWINTIEYGEILLIGPDGTVKRAYPMPALPPKWLYADDDAIFAGAIGDGALPSSSLIRIDRATFEHSVVVFPHDASRGHLLLPTWRLCTESEAATFEDAVDLDSGTSGMEVVSAIGPLRIDIDAVAQLFVGDQAAP